MKDLTTSIIVSVAATIGSYYIIREIESNFWRTKEFYNRSKGKFKKATV